ncbi:hypothetical protein BDF19DRAFT_68438 [Syncephalis fuscata]|nr:hypothetical protein BDF19DRAFT_68438 [Syncephalis fuscata]
MSTTDSSYTSASTRSKFSFVDELVAEDMPRHIFLDSPAYNTRAKTSSRSSSRSTTQSEYNHVYLLNERGSNANRASGHGQKPYKRMRKPIKLDSGKLSESFLERADRLLQSGGSLLSLAVSVGPNSLDTDNLIELLNNQDKSSFSRTSSKQSHLQAPSSKQQSTKHSLVNVSQDSGIKAYSWDISPKRQPLSYSMVSKSRGFSFVNSPLLARRSPHLVRHYAAMHKPARLVLLPSSRSRLISSRNQENIKPKQKSPRRHIYQYKPQPPTPLVYKTYTHFQSRKRRRIDEDGTVTTSPSMPTSYWRDRSRFNCMFYN